MFYLTHWNDEEIIPNEELKIIGSYLSQEVNKCSKLFDDISALSAIDLHWNDENIIAVMIVN